MNYIFFHNSNGDRKINKPLSYLIVDGKVITDKANIGDHVVNFCSALFNVDSVSTSLDDAVFVDLFPDLVFAFENDH